MEVWEYGSMEVRMEEYGRIWKYMEVYGSIWKYMANTLATASFSLSENTKKSAKIEERVI